MKGYTSLLSTRMFFLRHRFLCWTILLFFIPLLAAGAKRNVKPSKKAATVVSPEKGIDALLDEITTEQSKSENWWNPQWRFRRQILIDDARLTGGNPIVILLSEPAPLLLANTGRCRPDGRDIRIVSDSGELLPSGVLNVRMDDGSSMIWCRLPPSQERPTQMSLKVYYGNPSAAEPGPESPRGPLGEPIHASVGPERTQPGDASLTPSNIVHQFVVVEAEKTCDAQGVPLVKNRKVSSQKLYMIDCEDGNERASGGAYLAPTLPWRPDPLPEPVEAWTNTILPEAGTWQVHVRYKTNPNGDAQKGPHFRPFTLILGATEWLVGTNQTPGAHYRWDSFQTELPAGKLRVGFRMPALAGPDCVLFTHDPEYRPDSRDYNGPVQMRFKVLNKVKPFFIELFCMTQPWSSHGPQGKTAGYVFGDQVIRTTPDAIKLSSDPKSLIQPGEWSPWIRALHSEAPTWWSTVSFYSGEQKSGSQGMKNLKVSFEFASRPDEWRVFNSGTEDTGEIPGLSIRMPDSLSKQALFTDTLTFIQAARKRYKLIEALNLKPKEGPSKIFLTTMVTSSGASGAEETELILKSCGLLGFNGIEARSVMPAKEFWKVADANGLEGATAHHWYPKNAVPILSQFKALPPAGQSCEAAFVKAMEKAAQECYSPTSRRWNEETSRVKLIIMGDEIGPAISPPFILRLPTLLGFFHEYLKTNGLSPDFFGKKEWAEVKPSRSDVVFTKGSESWKLMVAIDPAFALVGKDKLPELPGVNETTPGGEADEQSLAETAAPTTPSSAAAESDQLSDMQAEETRAADELAKGETPGPAPDKRLHYWTQRFRSYYTAMFYKICSREINRVADAGHFKTRPRSSPNFQAFPIMRAQMWDGALNLFEWGRMGATDFMAMEDWNWDPYRIAFGMEILRAAARNRGQEVGALIVGGSVKQRFLADLGNGSRSFLSYVYGPLRVIGPPWSDDACSVKDWSELARWVAKSEPDLLAATNRPCDAAILVANTSEINTPWINTAFHRYPLIERAAMFIALRDAGIPAEVVGEEEVLEDHALSRYKLLYVSDPHVSLRCQEKIKEWVRQGGVLWSSYAALARNEYDEPSSLFDEVYGLKSRPPLMPSAMAWEPGKAEEIHVAGGGLFKPFTFKGIPYNPKYELSTGKPLAVFGDHAPALIHNRFGQGQAYLLACTARQLTGDHGPQVGDEPDAALKRELLAAPARAAGVRPHLSMDHSRVIGYVHDGPTQSIVFLANCFNADLPDLTVKVYLPRKPSSAYSGRLANLPFTWENDHAVVKLPINMLDGELLVFHYAEAMVKSPSAP